MTNYWWVNQGQTYNHEVTRGYLWAPKRKRNGASSPFYDSMNLLKRGDIVFSYHSTRINAVGVVTREAYSFDVPDEFGKAGEVWDRDGWKADVEFKSVLNPVRPKDLFAENPDLPLDKNGNGKQAIYLTAIPEILGLHLLEITKAPKLTLDVGSLDEVTHDPEEQQILADIHLSETEKRTQVLARRGQGVFRDRVELVEQKCRVTGVSARKLLIASHIKPWKESEAMERLDGNNGLFLSPHVDKLFDGGFISFSNKGEMLVSDVLPSEVLPKWNINPNRKYGKFNADQASYLEHHRELIFDVKPRKKSKAE